MLQVQRSNSSYITRLITFLTLAFILSGQVLPNMVKAEPQSLSTALNGSAQPGLVALESNILPILQQGRAQLVTQATPTQILDLGLSLGLHNTELLNEWLREIYTPGNSNYGKFISSQQFNRMFAPTQEDQDAVIEYLQAQGLTVYKTFENHGLIRVKGTVLQVQNAFGVSINNYRTPEGRVFYANAQPPKLPATIASKVSNVQGLENFVKPQHHYVGHNTNTTSNLPGVAQAISSPKSTTGGGPNGGLTPAQWQSFYNLSSLYNSNIKGQGQVLAITAFDTYLPNDFSTFLQQYNLPNIPVEVRGAGSAAFPYPSSPNEFEVITDMEIAAATAPMMSKLVLYQDIDQVTVFQEFVNDRVASVLSNSYGVPCDTAQPSSYLAAQTQVLQQAAAQGQTVVVSSGDDLAYSCSNFSVPAGSQSNNPSIGTPDDNPWVLAVGGTSINFSSNPTSSTLSYTGETVWNCPQTDTISNCQGKNQGSTGGVSSTYFAQPWWQHGVTDAILSSTGRTGRATPDLSLYADVRDSRDSVIEPGYSVYCSDQAFCADTPGWLYVGGTSMAGTVMAGIVLLANQAKGAPLGFVNPTIYALGSSGSAASIFHDITNGNNGAYTASAGWDAATGFGSVDANAFVNALKTATPPTTPTGFGPVYHYYVPFAAGNPKNLANSYDTALYIQNETANPSKVTITYYSQAGAVLGSETPQNGTVAGHGQLLLNQAFSGPLSVGNGTTASAIIQSDQPLNIMVTESTPVGASAYNAISNIADIVDQDASTPGYPGTLPAATSNVLLPVIYNSPNFFKTTINILNGGSRSTTVNIAYYDALTGNQVATESRQVAANGSVSVDNSASTSVVPSGFNGSAVVSSPDGVPLAVQVVENYPAINFVASYPGVGIPGQQIFAPAIYNNTFGHFYTGMNLVNPSGDAIITATVTFYKEDGSVVGKQSTGNIPPHGVVGLFQGNSDPSKGVVLPSGVSMSALVQASGPVAITVNESGGGSVAGSYSGLLAGSSVLNLPTIQSNFFGGTSGLVVQNVGNSQVTASLQYYDPSGNPIGNAVSLTIPAHAIVNQYNTPAASGLPNNFVGNAVITAAPGSQLVVTCNVSNSGATGVTNPYFYSYTAP